MTDFIDINSLDAEAKKVIKGLITELSGSMARAEAERELQKNAIADTSEKYGIDPKIIRKMAKVYHNDTFNRETEENDKFQEFYAVIIGD